MGTSPADASCRYVHHLVTIALILMSWNFGFQQIGTVVLYVHDASDITIDLLKMFNYLKLEVCRSGSARIVSQRCCATARCILQREPRAENVSRRSHTGLRVSVRPCAHAPRCATGPLQAVCR